MLRRDPLRISAVLGLVLAVLAVLVPAAAATEQASARGVRPCSQVEVIAHRGLHNKRHTEDTLAAFANAVNHGVGVIDGDLRLSGDGSWVFLHDPTLGRTTHGRGAVHQLPDAYLASVRNNDRRVGLTFLPPALELLRASPGTRFEIEIKPADAPVDKLQVLLSQLNGYGVTQRVLLTSRSTTVLDRVRQLAPGVQTGLITRDAAITPEIARAYGSTVILGAYASRPPLVAAMRSAGLRVETWTVDRRKQFKRAVKSRSNAVITDRLLDVRKWCR